MDERAHAVILAHRLIEFANSIDALTTLQREAIGQSLETGSLIRDVESALVEARKRERESHEHVTPLVHVSVSPAQRSLTEDSNNRATLPTEPTVSYEDAPARVRTSRGFPRVG